MLKQLKWIVKPFWLSIGIITIFFSRISRFIIPNLYAIAKKRVVYDKIPNCNQKTLITGSGKVLIGDDCMFGYKPGGFHKGGCIEFQPRTQNAMIKLGKNVSTNNNLFFCASNYIEIGDDTLIGQYVTIMDFEAHGIEPTKRRKNGPIGKVIIGKNVWIGNNVTILKNSEVGENSIVATGAVVSGKFPSNVIIGGVPAKVIKTI